MKFEQRFYPEDKKRFEEAGCQDVLFFTADTPDGWLICVIHSRDPIAAGQHKLHLSVSVRPVWGMIRGREVTDQELGAVKEQFSTTQFVEDNAGRKNNLVRNLWEQA